MHGGNSLVLVIVEWGKFPVDANIGLVNCSVLNYQKAYIEEWKYETTRRTCPITPLRRINNEQQTTSTL